jgi:hypothetical protein
MARSISQSSKPPFWWTDVSERPISEKARIASATFDSARLRTASREQVANDGWPDQANAEDIG